MDRFGAAARGAADGPRHSPARHAGSIDRSMAPRWRLTIPWSRAGCEEDRQNPPALRTARSGAGPGLDVSAPWRERESLIVPNRDAQGIPRMLRAPHAASRRVECAGWQFRLAATSPQLRGAGARMGRILHTTGARSAHPLRRMANGRSRACTTRPAAGPRPAQMGLPRMKHLRGDGAGDGRQPSGVST